MHAWLFHVLEILAEKESELIFFHPLILCISIPVPLITAHVAPSMLRGREGDPGLRWIMPLSSVKRDGTCECPCMKTSPFTSGNGKSSGE